MTKNAKGEVEIAIEESYEHLRLLDQERQGNIEFPGIYCACAACFEVYAELSDWSQQ